MAWYEGSHTEVIAAPAERAFDAMTNYDAMPTWQGPLRRCSVIERDGDGTATVVEYEIATPVKSVTYRMRHREEAPAAVHGELIEGDLKGFRGSWTFSPLADDRVEVTAAGAIDPGLWVPKKIVSMLQDSVLRRAVRDLKRYLEG